MPTSVMTMTEMPHGKQIRGSPKNLLARSNPSKLDCRHHTSINSACYAALTALAPSRCLKNVRHAGAQQQQQRNFGASQDLCLVCKQMLKVEGSCTCIPVSKLMQRATGTLPEPDTLKRVM